MSGWKRRFLPLSGFIIVVLLLGASMVNAQYSSSTTSGKEHKTYLPLITNPVTDKQAEIHYLNYLRSKAGVPLIVEDPVLTDNCFEHARYMAENNVLDHNEDPNKPYYSALGQSCGNNANIWLGTEKPYAPWQPMDPLKSWMMSVPHRLWILYPTTTSFGFGFYSSNVQRAGAAVDVLSHANFAADEVYNNWPVRYPGAGQKDIPASRYPITLNWRYFGSTPKLNSVRLTGANGVAIPHEANTALVSGHKGIQILPKADLPENSIINVTVSGRYDGRPFTYTWRFTTGNAEYTPPLSQFGTAIGR